jgi:DNA-3-methyladenine glycosylase
MERRAHDTTAASGSGRWIAGIDFTKGAPHVARRLIGTTLLVGGAGGVIVETEAYDEGEAASHAFRGLTPRTKVLFGPPGRAYVYLSYGLHWCLNFVCREDGHGAGVLIRALEPTVGLSTMKKRRGKIEASRLCAGPGRLCRALGVTEALNGRRIDQMPFRILPAECRPAVVVGTRIGITRAVAKSWRFGLKGSPCLSRPFPRSLEGDS